MGCQKLLGLQEGKEFPGIVFVILGGLYIIEWCILGFCLWEVISASLANESNLKAPQAFFVLFRVLYFRLVYPLIALLKEHTSTKLFFVLLLVLALIFGALLSTLPQAPETVRRFFGLVAVAFAFKVSEHVIGFSFYPFFSYSELKPAEPGCLRAVTAALRRIMRRLRQHVPVDSDSEPIAPRHAARATPARDLAADDGAPPRPDSELNAHRWAGVGHDHDHHAPAASGRATSVATASPSDRAASAASQAPAFGEWMVQWPFRRDSDSTLSQSWAPPTRGDTTRGSALQAREKMGNCAQGIDRSIFLFLSYLIQVMILFST